MKRTIAAFLIAPLILAATLFLLPGFQERVVTSDINLPTALIAAVIVAYAFVLVAVLPPFLVLRGLGYTRFWIAPAQGAVTAILIWIIATIVRVSGRDSDSVLAALEQFALHHPTRLLLLVSIGAAEVTVIWLIARPDRSHREKLRKAQEAAEARVF